MKKYIIPLHDEPHNIIVTTSSYNENPDVCKYELPEHCYRTVWISYEGQWYRSKDTMDAAQTFLYIYGKFYTQELLLTRILNLI